MIWISIRNNGKVWNWAFVSKSGEPAFDKMIDMTLKQFMVGGNYSFTKPPANWELQQISITVEGKDMH